MFELWVLHQIVISIFITVVLGGFLTAILGYRMSKKIFWDEDSALKQK